MADDNTNQTNPAKSEAEQKADAEALANDQSNVVDTTNGQGDPTQNTNDNASADTQASPADNTNEASPQATPQGEVAVDQGARAHVLGEDTPSDPLDAKNEALSQAKSDAVENHAREHENDNATNSADTNRATE